MPKVPFRPLNGVLLLDKQEGITSNRALQDARFLFRAKKAGHTGTLDPFATGLLPLCFGEANKYARWLLSADKTYRFTAILGQQSSTGDSEGNITLIDTSPHVTLSQLQQAEIHFKGDINQIPPNFSAVKINGQRAYDLARKGTNFEIPTRQVTVHQLELSVSDNQLHGLARVSKGTYIRTLVEDIARHMGTVAYCNVLRRVHIAHLRKPLCEVNTFIKAEQDDNQRPMYTIDSLRDMTDETKRDQLLLPMDILCQQFPEQVIMGEHWQKLILGRQFTFDSPLQGIIRLYLDNVFCGLGEINDGQLKAFRLLNTGF